MTVRLSLHIMMAESPYTASTRPDSTEAADGRLCYPDMADAPRLEFKSLPISHLILLPSQVELRVRLRWQGLVSGYAIRMMSSALPLFHASEANHSMIAASDSKSNSN